MNILLVEDDPGIERFIRRGLAAEGFTVRWARTAAEGRALLAGPGFAAAILDLGLPDMDGVDLCSRVRRDGVTTPILMLTARGGLEDKLEGFQSGADDYLSKPFAFEELVARLKVLVRRGRPSRPVLFADLQLDPNTRTCRIGDRSAVLPAREFDVLACLATAAGGAVTRETILEHAWGPASSVADNTVDVYVGYVRRRLKQLGDAPRIETVRGVGFRLTAEPKV